MPKNMPAATKKVVTIEEKVYTKKIEDSTKPLRAAYVKKAKAAAPVFIFLTECDKKKIKPICTINNNIKTSWCLNKKFIIIGLLTTNQATKPLKPKPPAIQA